MKNVTLEHLRQSNQLAHEGTDWLACCVYGALLMGLPLAAIVGHMLISRIPQ